MQQPSRTDVEIRTKAHPQTASIGDKIRIDLDITTPQGYRIEIPEPERQTDDFFILDFFPASVVSETHQPEESTQSSESPDVVLQQHQARIIAAIYKTGLFTFPGIPIFITANDGKKTEIQSPSVNIEIQSILTGNDQELRDLKKQADIPEPIQWLLWALLVSAVSVAGAAAWYFGRKYRKPSIPVPSSPAQNPFDLALRDLKDLIAGKLPENGDTKKFYILLSEIVKRILEAAYEVHTAEQTTIEIMASLQRLPVLKQDDLEEIESLLLQCDVVKFAKYIPSKTENENSAEGAFRILAQAREYWGRTKIS